MDNAIEIDTLSIYEEAGDITTYGRHSHVPS